MGGLRVPGWSADAECLTADGEFRLYRAETRSGDFVLERDGEIVARAVKPVMFWPRFDVQIGSRTFMLGRGWRRGTFTLYEDGRRLGSVRRGVFTRRVYIDLPQGLPLPAQVFVFWLVLVSDAWVTSDSRQEET